MNEVKDELSAEMQKAQQEFKEKEAKRLENEKAGRIHNCKESGCEIAPDGRRFKKDKKTGIIDYSSFE